MKNYKGEECVLMKDGKEIKIGEVHTTYRGERMTVVGGKPPQKPSSEGKIYVRDDKYEFSTEYYPSVIGAEWVVVK